jgi:hypothetical protein
VKESSHSRVVHNYSQNLAKEKSKIQKPQDEKGIQNENELSDQCIAHSKEEIAWKSRHSVE